MSCTLQWSLSGHQHVCISNSQEAITHPHTHTQLRKTSNVRCSQINQYWSYKPHSNFKPTWMFFKILYVSFKWYFWQKLIISMLVWGFTAKTRCLVRLSPTHSQPHLSRLCANFTWTLNTIYSTGGLPYWGIQRYEPKWPSLIIRQTFHRPPLMMRDAFLPPHHESRI